CTVLVRPPERYCAEHLHLQRQRGRAYDRDRGSAAKRGYDHRWRRIREHYLRRHPLCEDCLEQGTVMEATEVHHTVPYRDSRRHREDELRALCKPCHSRRTARGE